MKRICAAAVAAVIGLSVGMLAQGARRDGLWDVKMEMDMPGMPMKMPAITSQQCITPADANDPNKMVPPQGRGRGGSNCTVSDYKQEGNKVTYKVACTGENPMTGDGEFVYQSDAYTGKMTMDMTGRGKVTMNYTGKRLGDCNK